MLVLYVTHAASFSEEKDTGHHLSFFFMVISWHEGAWSYHLETGELSSEMNKV